MELHDSIVSRMNGIPDWTLAGWVGSECELDGQAVRQDILGMVALTPEEELPLPHFQCLRTWWELASAAALVRIAFPDGASQEASHV